MILVIAASLLVGPVPAAAVAEAVAAAAGRK